jgi:hypothetical protein
MNESTIHLQQLLAERDHLRFEMEALRNKIEGLEIAINVVSGGRPEQALPTGRRPHVSEVIMNLLRDSGETGLKPRTAIDLAARAGISLNRGSVYTLLNRMARTGVIVHEGSRYKLNEFARQGEVPGIAEGKLPRLPERSYS